MSDYRARMYEAKKKLDQRLEDNGTRREEGKCAAKIFFEENKEGLVNLTLEKFIKCVETDSETHFEFEHIYTRDIRNKSKSFREAYNDKLCSLIISSLSELTPDFCHYDVIINEEVEPGKFGNNIYIQIVMDIED